MKFSSHIVSGLLPLLAIATPVAAFEPVISLGGAHVTIHPSVATLHAAGGTFFPAGSADEILATREQTGGQFSVVTLASNAGDGPGPTIIHANEAEAWYVLEGTYEFHVGDKTVEGGAGTFVAVDAGQPHGYVARTAGKLLVMFSPGGFEQFFIDWDKQGLKPGPDLGKLEASYGVTRP